MMAQRAIREGGTTAEDRLLYAFRLALSRKPNDSELRTLRNSLAFYADHYQTDRDAAMKLVSQGDAARDSNIDQAQLAAYTAVASLILNLDETITKE